VSGAGEFAVLIRFTESVGVRLWGRELHNFRKGEIHRVSIAVAGVLLAQGCAEPVADPPALPRAVAA
jgi:hypothetical protein